MKITLSRVLGIITSKQTDRQNWETGTAANVNTVLPEKRNDSSRDYELSFDIRLKTSYLTSVLNLNISFIFHCPH